MVCPPQLTSQGGAGYGLGDRSPGWKKGGVSNQSEHPDQWGSGALTADLVLNNVAFYKPVTRSEEGSGDDASPINRVLFQKPTPWPTATPGQHAAFLALGKKVGLGDQPRVSYYSRALNFLDVQGDVDRTTYEELKPGSSGSCQPAPPPGDFCKADFVWAQRELRTELGYVVKVETYVHLLSRPYKGAGAGLWSSFNKVVQDVNNSTFNERSAQVTAIASAVINAVLDSAHAIKSIERAATVVAAAYRLALELADTGSESSDEPFDVQAAELGSKLTQRLNDAESEMSNSLAQHRRRRLRQAEDGRSMRQHAAGVHR